jgi:hypothetical protein
LEITGKDFSKSNILKLSDCSNKNRIKKGANRKQIAINFFLGFCVIINLKRLTYTNIKLK